MMHFVIASPLLSNHHHHFLRPERLKFKSPTQINDTSFFFFLDEAPTVQKQILSTKNWHMNIKMFVGTMLVGSGSFCAFARFFSSALFFVRTRRNDDVLKTNLAKPRCCIHDAHMHFRQSRMGCIRRAASA